MTRRDWLRTTVAALGLLGIGRGIEPEADEGWVEVEVDVITGYGPCGEVVAERVRVRRPAA